MINKSTLIVKNFNISVLTKHKIIYIYIYNNNYYCFLKFTKNFKLKLKNNIFLEVTHLIDLNFNQLNKYLKQFYFYKFIKIRFTGKGYKIKKNTFKSMVLLFNRAHITLLWWNNLFIKRLKKYKIYVRYINTNVVKSVVNIRFINVFTKKGLRQSRQILLKKKGKK